MNIGNEKILKIVYTLSKGYTILHAHAQERLLHHLKIALKKLTSI